MKDLKNKEKYIVWHIDGGLGKNVAATSLCKSIKDKHPDRKLILVVSFPEVFLNNPYIDRVYHLGSIPYFYEDYIENKDTLIYRHEPYFQKGHINQTNHIIESWCELLDIEYNNQQPDLYVNYAQSKTVNVWNRPKPILVLQTGGGPIEGQKSPYSWARDMPPEIAQGIVNVVSREYHVIQITRPNGYEIEGVERIDHPLENFEMFSLLIAAQKRILIDSCLQHAAAAFNKTSTVLWIGTSPEQFGYRIHNNLIASLPKIASQRISSYLYPYSFQDNIHECPYVDVDEIFNLNKILNTI